PSAPRDLALVCDALLERDASARPTSDGLRTAFGSACVPACEPFPAEQAELLGRTSDLAALRMAYQTTCSGQAVAMFVSGESGIGKTALCQTFLDQLPTAGEAVVLAGRCHERESVPFKGIDNLVDDLS